MYFLLEVSLCTFKENYRFQNDDFGGINEVNEIIVDITTVKILRKKEN